MRYHTLHRHTHTHTFVLTGIMNCRQGETKAPSFTPSLTPTPLLPPSLLALCLSAYRDERDERERGGGVQAKSEDAKQRKGKRKHLRELERKWGEARLSRSSSCGRRAAKTPNDREALRCAQMQTDTHAGVTQQTSTLQHAWHYIEREKTDR